MRYAFRKILVGGSIAVGGIPVGDIVVCERVTVRNVVRSCDKPWGVGVGVSVDEKWASTTTFVFGPL